MNYNIAKGVFDILPNDTELWRSSYIWQFVEDHARKICKSYNYLEIRTPLFETTDLFTRSIGDTTDIVKKEMYTFQDRAERSLTLRPEGTAPVMRALIEKNLAQFGGKFFYIYPIFRYERQQAGRYRQHHQFGVEAVGSPSFLQDCEVIQLLWTFYKQLGLTDLTLHLNSIGESDDRKNFCSALKSYLEPHIDELSEDSKRRFTTNPLRILDSKDPGDQKILEGAPSILNFLSKECREDLDKVCSLLNSAKIPFVLNDRLVRGLDYYNRTVFEVTSSQLGAQNSLGGGGRYDGLIKQLGGPDIPAFGFGTGLERVIQTMIAQKAPLPTPPAPLLMIIPLGEESFSFCFNLASLLRSHNLSVELDLSLKKLKQMMRHADDVHARYVAVVGSEEVMLKSVNLKEMSSGNSKSVHIDRLIHELQKNS